MVKKTAAARNLQTLMNQGVIPTGQQSEIPLPPDEQPKGVAGAKLQEILSNQGRKVVQDISLDLLLDNPYQPREHIDIDDELKEMAEGIDEYNMLGAIPVRHHPEREGFFQLVYGHRRREASRLANKSTMPCVVEDVENTVMEVFAALENVHRKDLTHLELGNYFLRMRREGYTQEEIAKKVKKNRGYVVNRLRLAEAPQDIQTFILTKPDSLRAVAYLIQVENEEDRALLIQHLITGTLLTDDLAGDISLLLTTLKTESSPQTFPTKDTPLQSEQQEMLGSEHSEGQEKKPPRDEARIGAAKLQRISRDLKIYAGKLSEREATLSSDELQAIQQIGDIYTTELLPHLPAKPEIEL
jgi:ParB family chromosome partitioning protein